MTTIYRYGGLAWVWRVMIALDAAIGLPLLGVGLWRGMPLVAAGSLVLLGPALFLGSIVAVRVDRDADGMLLIRTLLFWRRWIGPEDLGRPRVRETAQGESGPIYAPRAWIPVRGQLPIYVDLLADIPDRRRFAAVFRLPPRC